MGSEVWTQPSWVFCSVSQGSSQGIRLHCRVEAWWGKDLFFMSFRLLTEFTALWLITEGSIFALYNLEAVLKSWKMLPGPSCVEFLNMAAYCHKPARRTSHLRKDPASHVRTLTWLSQTHPDNFPFEELKISLLGILITFTHPFIFAILGNLIEGVTSHHFCHSPLVRSKSQVQPTLKEKGLYKAWIPGGRKHRICDRLCPQQSNLLRFIAG